MNKYDYELVKNTFRKFVPINYLIPEIFDSSNIKYKETVFVHTLSDYFETKILTPEGRDTCVTFTFSDLFIESEMYNQKKVLIQYR